MTGIDSGSPVDHVPQEIDPEPAIQPRLTSGVPTGRDLMSGRALFRIGLALVIGALIYFLRYSIEQGWISPLGQLGLAAATGLAMVVVGDQISRSRPLYGNLLQGGGGAALYLTAFAAHQRSELTDAPVTTVLLVAISAGILGMALRHQSQPLSLVGLSGGLAAPILLGDGYDPLVTVMILTVAAALFITQHWRLAFGFAAGASTVSIALASVLSAAPIEVAVGLIGLFLGVWGVSMFVAARRPQSIYDATVIPVLTSAAIPVFVYAASVYVFSIERPTRLALAAAIAAVALATRNFLRRRRLPSLVIDALLVPAAAVPVLAFFGSLDLPVAILLATIEAAALLILGLRTHNPNLTGVGVVGMALLGVNWLFDAAYPLNPRFDLEDASMLVFVLATFAVFALTPNDAPEPAPMIRATAKWFALGLAILWPLVALQPIGTGFVTAVWVVLGLGMVVGGKLRDRQLARNIGLGITALGVGKLLVVDTAEVAPLGRVALFAGIGLALLIVGFWLGDDRAASEPAVPVVDNPPSQPISS